jgi:hypothetical protein
MSGNLTLQQEQVMRGQILAFNAVLALEWPQIIEFYAARGAKGPKREG